MKKLITLTIAATLAGCATPPGMIKAASTSEACRAGDMQRLAVISAEQKSKANNDIMGLLILGVPMGTVTGETDHSAEIAAIKGRCNV